MVDAFWMQLGATTFALEVGEQIVGNLFWLNAELIAGDGRADRPIETGWYWVSVGRPRKLHRVARGLELREEMAEEEVTGTVQKVLAAGANEVLAEGGD